ncbi:arginyl-tRNA synthetase [Pilaira anomala]|nr:arginyl-tRNA synthetase [Pilaira anomala]
MSVRLKFKQAIANQLLKQTPCQPKDITSLMRPSRIPKLGDISITLPKLNASLENPLPKQELAAWSKDVTDKFEPNELIESVSVDKANLFFKFNQPEFNKQVLQQVYHDNKSYGWSHLAKPEASTVLIDYSSPNIAKPFHAGHLRSTIIGNFIRIIHESMGYHVIGINYLGDWGKQYGLLAVGFEKYGDESKLISDPIHHLYQVYVQINADAKQDKEIDKKANEYFKNMEQGDPEALKQWSRFREMSIQSYASIYERLNVKFDVYSGESQVNNYIQKANDILKDRNLLTHTEDNAYAVDLEQYQLGKVVVKRADGTSLYVTRDLASILMRKEKYPFQKAIYVVGSEQAAYFREMFQISNLMMDKPLELEHVGFGRIKGMSTRNGTVVFLQDILDTAKERILEYMNADAEKSQMEDIDTVADQLGMSAILIQDMKSKRGKDYEFSWERMTDARGDTGVFLQYAHAKVCGIERKAGIKITPHVDFSILKEKEALDLVQSISTFPEVVESAFKSLEPSAIVNYLFKLAHATSAASAFLRVKDMDQNISEARMLLFWSARITLRNGLHLLGIKPIKKM